MLHESMSSTVHSLLRNVHSILHQTETPVDLTTLFSRFTMEEFAEIGFGVQFNSLHRPEEHAFQSAFDGAGEALAMRFIVPKWFWKLQRWLNVGAEHKLKQHVQVIDTLVLGIISKAIEQRQTSSTHHDTRKKGIVSLFLDQHLRHGSSLQEFEPRLLRDIVLNFLAAGRDTTSAILTWFFYAMARNPQAERTVRQEQAHRLPRLVNGELLAPSLKQLQEFPFLEAAVKESLRLYPTIPANIRETNQDVVLCDGTFIRKGTTAHFPSYALGRMKWVWGPDARQVNPEQWIDEATGRVISVSPYKFNVFLAGPPCDRADHDGRYQSAQLIPVRDCSRPGSRILAATDIEIHSWTSGPSRAARWSVQLLIPSQRKTLSIHILIRIIDNSK